MRLAGPDACPLKPILLRLSPHRRRVRVLELEPVRRPPGPMTRSPPLRGDPLLAPSCRMPRPDSAGSTGAIWWPLSAHHLAVDEAGPHLEVVGCAAIDDLRVSIFQWFDTANLTEEGEEPLAYAPEPRLIPPAEIPKRAAKAPRKVLKAKPQRPPAIVLPQENYRSRMPQRRQHQAKPRDSPHGQLRYNHELTIVKRRRPSKTGFAPSAGARPQKLSEYPNGRVSS